VPLSAPHTRAVPSLLTATSRPSGLQDTPRNGGVAQQLGPARANASWPGLRSTTPPTSPPDDHLATATRLPSGLRLVSIAAARTVETTRPVDRARARARTRG